MTAIVFDLDGTLLDTLDDLTAATNHILRSYGRPERTREEVRGFVGNGARCQLEQSFAPAPLPEAALEDYLSYYSAQCQEHTRPYPGIPEALAQLGERYPLAIVSNKPDAAVKALCARHFPGILALGERPGTPRKPAPDLLYAALEALGAQTCLYVGDSEVDQQTAQNAQVPYLLVPWGYRPIPTPLCPTPTTLPQTIQELLK